MIVTCSDDKTVKVWQRKSLDLLATLRHNKPVFSAAVSEKHIVTLCRNDYVYIYQSCSEYSLAYSFRIGTSGWNRISFINDDIIMVPDTDNNLSFVSLSTRSFVSRVRLDYNGTSVVVLSDAKIAVGCDQRNCWIIDPPESVRSAVRECAIARYGLPIVSAHDPLPPLRKAWIDVRNEKRSLRDVCETMITTENCCTSLDEWCIAHELLMEAVKRRELPATRNYNGNIVHWYEVLYPHCAKLAMGEKNLVYVKSMFQEAEEVGVISVGQTENLLGMITLRRDMDADNRFVVHSIYQLFMRQAETDVRLRQVLHYQRVQQITSLVNAVVGLLIPVGGSIATNLIGGGAAILNDMQVCGLVGSLLGVAQDATGGLGGDALVDKFLQRTNKILSIAEWSELPDERRKDVERAATSLGLTVEELRKSCCSSKRCSPTTNIQISLLKMLKTQLRLNRFLVRRVLSKWMI